ncbi:MAG: hypothetical protein QT08_C0009G0036 [archaeon GW2011_AR17]|nr:MAG: hypothetical protein QT08_C0009G0036 [archaeon GW2011_AR17]
MIVIEINSMEIECAGWDSNPGDLLTSGLKKKCLKRLGVLFSLKRCILLADQRIVSFIQSALAKGNSRSQIQQVLLQKGWKQEQISEAFTAATSSGSSSSSQTVKKPFATKKPLFIILGAVFLLAILGIAYTFIPDSSDVECSSDRDCSRGYSCDSGSCILEEIITDDDSFDDIEEEEPECGLDSDCNGGYACSLSGNCYDSCTSTSGCAAAYSCASGICVAEEEEDEDNASVKPNYLVSSLAFTSFSFAPSVSDMSTFHYLVNVSNDGEGSSSQTFTLACSLGLENESILGRNYIKVTGHDLGEGESTLYTCNGNSSILYSLVQDLNVLNGTSTGSECASLGYTCARNSYCYNVCTSAGGECASGYSCTGGVCVVVFAVEDCGNSMDDDGDSLYDCNDSDCTSDSACAASTEDVCTDVLPGCADGVDNDADGDSDLEDSDCGSDWNVEEDSVEVEVFSESICTDSLDNDGDGLVDCLDDDCVYDNACVETISCFDSDSSVTDPYIEQGIVTVVSGEEVETETDSCSLNTLQEYFCAEDYTLSYANISCSTAYGSTASCSNGACVLPSSGNVASESETVACVDAVDNDKDGMYDWLGACDKDETIISCVSLIPEEIIKDEGYDLVAYCEASCKDINGDYLEADTECDSTEDDSESAVVASSLKGKKLSIKFFAPEGEETSFQRFLSFLFQSDAVLDHFLDVSFFP